MHWIHPLDVWNRHKRTLNIDESTNIYTNKHTVIKRFGRWLYARISKRCSRTRGMFDAFSGWRKALVHTGNME